MTDTITDVRPITVVIVNGVFGALASIEAAFSRYLAKNRKLVFLQAEVSSSEEMLALTKDVDGNRIDQNDRVFVLAKIEQVTIGTAIFERPADLPFVLQSAGLGYRFVRLLNDKLIELVVHLQEAKPENVPELSNGQINVLVPLQKGNGETLQLASALAQMILGPIFPKYTNIAVQEADAAINPKDWLDFCRRLRTDKKVSRIVFLTNPMHLPKVAQASRDETGLPHFVAVGGKCFLVQLQFAEFATQ